MREEVLRIENLTHVYSAGTPFERVAVDNVSLSVHHGEFIGLIGHTDCGQRIVHTFAQFGPGQPQIFAGKGHVFLHHGRNDLVVRVLEDHTCGLADVKQQVFFGSVHSCHIHLAAGRQQNAVKMLGKGAFAAAVMT